MSDRQERSEVTGSTVADAQFDRSLVWYLRWSVSLFMVISVVGIAFIPFWLLYSMWYCPEYLRRISARLTTEAVEVRKGVFLRSVTTIPLNRITDVRMYDGPLMRFHELRGLRVETAGGQSETGSEGKVVGVVGPREFRNAILAQRQRVMDAERGGEAPGATTDSSAVLIEIRDILKRMEERQGL